MKVYKFGGASVKDASAIKNIAGILKKNTNESLVVVVSAMGDTTNLLELLAENGDSGVLEFLRERHFNVSRQLGLAIDDRIEQIFGELEMSLAQTYPPAQRNAAIVSAGELLSTTIVSASLETAGIQNTWVDARKVIRTDSDFAEGIVNWETTSDNVRLMAETLQGQMIITQGFIAADDQGRTTILGREGSDFTAAILAYCLEASSVTVWKDVDGIMNGDPKKFSDLVKFAELPYREAAEMTYYGASVIHPKTIKPLANKNIPLFVKSFYHPEESGTVIHDCTLEGIPPSISIKHRQCLVSFLVRDFTFINEKNLSMILHEISEIHLKINLMQTSAISLSVCMDYHRERIALLMDRLRNHFSIRYNTGLDLITIKHFTRDFLDRMMSDKQVILEQMSRHNYQALITPAEVQGIH